MDPISVSTSTSPLFTADVLRLVLSSSFVLAGLYLLRKFLGIQQPLRPHGESWGLQQSNIADEFSYSPDGVPDPRDWRVKSLWIYPIKSCQGVELKQANVVSTGLEYDRQFTFAEYRPNAKSGVSSWIFCTQRQYSNMAQIRTKLHVDQLSESGGTISIKFPMKTSWPFGKMKSFQVPLDPTEKGLMKLPLTPVTIWKDTTQAHDFSSLCRTELKELQAMLGGTYQLGLFRVPSSQLREVLRCAPKKEELGYQPVVAFNDAYPLHMMNLHSVRDLNEKIKEDLPQLSVRRFRPNIIIEGPKAFDEDNWKKVSFGDHEYYAACRTVRCRLPNVNPETGVKHLREPDRTLRKYRKIDAGDANNACLGMQLVPALASGSVRVGDSVKVKERGDHLYIKQ